MLELIRALFIESNPVPVKTSMNLLGLPAGDLRQPLAPLKEENLEVLKKAL
jgi:4-hydroxy-tetrahydrodipicolinate synthase